jgi:hypothetical protein
MSIALSGPPEADIIREERPDGSVWLQSTKPLPPFSTRVTERLEHWARLTPNQPFLAARGHSVGCYLNNATAERTEKVAGHAAIRVWPRLRGGAYLRSWRPAPT